MEIEINPDGVLYHYKNVTLVSDIIFVKNIISLIIISRHTHFGTLEMITDKNTIILIQSVVNVIRLYNKIGFRIYTLHVDGNFDTSRIRGAVAEFNVTLNPMSDNEHVPKSEIYSKNIKESSRCVQKKFPFKKIPGLITMELVLSCVFWLNVYPSKSGVQTK